MRLRLISCALMRAIIMAIALTLPACTGGQACTEIGCDSEAEVTYNGFAISSRYDLTLDLGSEKVLVRCNDSGSMEELDNPDYVTCSAGGFEIIGEEANQTSILVTIYDIDADEVIAINQTVQLSVEPNGEIQPNGPDCPPVCYKRFGSVLSG